MAKKKTELVMVEAVQTFRQRYVIEVPVGKEDWALDTVTCEQAKEFSQLYLGETIISHRVIDEKEALVQCTIDNDYCKTWNNQAKVDAFFTLEKDLKNSVNS